MRSFIIFAIALAAISSFYYLNFTKSAISSTASVFVVSGDSTDEEIIRNLKDKGFIRHTWLFNVVRIAKGRVGGGEIEPGGYNLNNKMSVWEVAKVITDEPQSKLIELPAGLNKEEVAEVLSGSLAWDDLQKIDFIERYLSLQTDQFGQDYIEILTERNNWKKTEIDEYNKLLDEDNKTKFDLFDLLYLPGPYLVYEFENTDNVAKEIFDRYVKNRHIFSASDLSLKINLTGVESVDREIQSRIELLPDLIPLPPLDLVVERENGRKLLRFTTTYWNAGNGRLRLVADERTSGKRYDHDRDVFQYIDRTDGGVRKRLAGNFYWEQEHLHYHFEDFVDYEMISLDDSSIEIGVEKATFCMRDIDIVDDSIPRAKKEAEFTVCGKERQGVSVGWGDSYKYNYPLQNIDVTDLPNGKYKLSFIVNPRDRFDETTLNNNTSYAIFDLDVEEMSVNVIETSE